MYSLTFRTVSKFRSSGSNHPEGSLMPAHWIATSTRPCALMASSKRASCISWLRTSTRLKDTVPPFSLARALRACSNLRPRSSFQSPKKTWAPLLYKISTVAAPIPWAPPEQNAISVLSKLQRHYIRWGLVKRTRYLPFSTTAFPLRLSVSVSEYLISAMMTQP